MGEKLCLAARWAIPVVGEPIHDAVVVIDNGIIEGVYARPQFNSIYKNQQIAHAEDYKDAVIMPGLINMHSHLDYSALRAFATDLHFFQWIKGLVTRSRDWSSDKWFQSALYGARLAAFTGTSTVVDSSYSGQAAKALAQVGLRGIVGLEVFGLSDAESDITWSNWLARFETLCETDFAPLKEALEKQTITLTVSPHAPYTVCPSLWLKAATWAKKFNLPVLAHLAESSEECQWLAQSNDVVHEFLSFSMRTDPDSEKLRPRWAGRGLTPVKHLKNYGLLNEWLIAAHAVHTDSEDLSILAEHKVKIAHCPRSNARLNNGLAPYSTMLEHGITVGLGTDSLASNDDLSLLSEAQFALNAHRLRQPGGLEDWQEHHLPTARQLVEAITMEAAIAIKMDHLIGSLQSGKRADIAVFALPPSPLSDSEKEALCPYNLLVSGGARLRDLLVDGQFIVSEGKLSRN
ncbi:MAG TPA: amidohydrolase family protein [Candidatus Melainabacteria bacterium]|nr:amidohydrolase family protein [Candidatus Melainabacteria bacterium]